MNVKGVDQLTDTLTHYGIADIIANFITDRQSRGLSRRTTQFYGDELRYFKQFLEKNHIETIAELSPNAIRTYLAELGEHRCIIRCKSASDSEINRPPILELIGQ